MPPISFLMDDCNTFPPINDTTDGDLIAIGGNLLPETLLNAYRSGIFPWYNEEDPICWHSPQKRCVIFPNKVKI